MSTLLYENPDALGPIESLGDVVRYLREHQNGHAEWIAWLEKHPEDVNPGVGSIEYQRLAVARYEKLIAVVNAAEAECAAARERLARLGSPIVDARNSED